MSLADVSNGRLWFLFISIALPITVAYGDQTSAELGNGQGLSAVCTRIKSNYLIEAGSEATVIITGGTEITGYGLTKKEFTNGWPPIR